MKQFFAPISKINAKTREVEGYLALEEKDKEGEIMDYDTSKAYFEEWSQGIQKASSGKSVGNLREMHRPFVAGKFTALTFDDANKRIHAVAKVSNDASWRKVLDGELNGFSIYGDPVKKWRDSVNKARRYTVKPFEGSLVDNPCMYGATFTRVTENGEEVVAKFAGNKGVNQYWDCGKDCDLYHKAKSDAVHCEGISKTQVGDDPEELEDIDIEDDFANDPQPVSKGMYDVSNLANNIASLKYLEVGTSENKEKFSKAIKHLFSVLTAMVKTEKENFLTSLDQLNVAASTVKAVGINLLKGEEEMSDKKIAEMDFDELTTELEKELTPKVAKSVAKSVGAVVKTLLQDTLEEITADFKEDVESLSKAIKKMAGTPQRTKAVVKQTDDEDEDDEKISKSKKSKSRKHDDEEESELSSTKRTSDTRHPELMKIMKAAMARPVAVVDHYNDENDEDNNEDEE